MLDYLLMESILLVVTGVETSEFMICKTIRVGFTKKFNVFKRMIVKSFALITLLHLKKINLSDSGWQVVVVIVLLKFMNTA